jgi:hypothetical protein
MIWLLAGLTVLAMLAARAVPIWLDGARRELPPALRLRWSLVGIVAPARFWWGARVVTMPPDEQADLLARETAALGLSRADSARCPLCGAEVIRAWTLASEGKPTVAPGPVRCPQCDFRLDACRHCVHFLSGAPRVWGSLALGDDDMTFGRCSVYKMPQPVEQICPPDIARRLKEQGLETLNAPTPIVDSFVPLDGCHAFQPGRERTRAGGVRWPDARRVALLRLLLSRSSLPASSPRDVPDSDEEWLL